MTRLLRILLPPTILSALLALPAWPQGFSPEEAVQRMKPAAGFEVKLVASEPMIRQPVTMTFDERGRLWVIQYLQYPTPAGLKAVSVDKYLRTVYDRIPEPPPKGPRGADRITILDDPDANGRYRKAKDFVADLNLASGMAIGHGGVFVAQPPYLLFYPDRNSDDIPDGNPEVLLTGFGMEDAHAFPNSLQWGPDGWLYGAQGSTVTARIRGIEFQQGIWRYHPLTKEFELFAEGGGNTWGVDFDRHGNLIAGTNNNGKTMLHQVQGGYYIKGFGKHGPLHNPHTYGYFDHIPYDGFKGGHVTCGGIVYQGGAYPEKYNNQYIASNPLANSLYWHKIERKGSTFVGHFGGDFLLGNDTWFRPVDCLTGPDGCVYVADWYDKRINHVDPVDNWDRTNGRIFKVVAQGTPAFPSFNLGKLSSKELIDLLSHRNDWQRREARRLLAERRDPAVIPVLRQMALEKRDELALEALWALYVSGGFDDALTLKLLDHANEDIRTWTIRLLGDAKNLSPVIEARLTSVARNDTSAVVRSQLACTSKRLPGKDCLPIVRELLQRDEDVNDIHIPLLLWWAIEDKAISDREQVLGLLESPAVWQAPIFKKYVVERLARRYMAEGSDAGYTTCSRILSLAPTPAEVHLMVQGMEKALEGQRLDRAPPALEKHLSELWKNHASDLSVVRLALRLGSEPAYQRALQLVADTKASRAERVSLIEILGQIGNAECVPIFLRLLRPPETEAVRTAALSALQPFADSGISATVLELYPKMSNQLRGRAQTLLCSRPASTLELLKAVDAGRVNAKEVPIDQVHRMLEHKQDELTRLVEKHWGKIGPATAGEKQSRIRSVGLIVRRGKGDPANGKLLFQKNCATCHTLFGEGLKIGPELDGADRKNLDYMASNIVDPSAVIRQEYVAYLVGTTDGRSLTGLIVESSPKAVTLLDGKNERTVIPRDKILEMNPSPQSLMPEKILDPLDDQQICDLFSYIMGEGPKKP